MKANMAEVNIICNMDYRNSNTPLQVKNPPSCRGMKGKRGAIHCALDANEENAINGEYNSYTSCKHII